MKNSHIYFTQLPQMIINMYYITNMYYIINVDIVLLTSP